MNGLDYAAPFLGAVALEVIHWYQLREKLQLERYRRLLRSTSYWVVTSLMVVVGGLGSLILANGELGARSLLVIGAAFPALFKELVSAARAREEVKLGVPEPDRSPLSDYFEPSR